MKKALTFILLTACTFNFSSCDQDEDQRCVELETTYIELIKAPQSQEQLTQLHTVISQGKDCDCFTDLALGTGHGSVDQLLKSLEADIASNQEGE